MMRTIDTLNNQVQSAQLEQELFERYYRPLSTVYCLKVQVQYTLCAAVVVSHHFASHLLFLFPQAYERSGKYQRGFEESFKSTLV